MSITNTTGPEEKYYVHFSPEDHQWVATCDQYPSLLWLDDDPSAALDGLLTVIVSERLSEAHVRRAQ